MSLTVYLQWESQRHEKFPPELQSLNLLFKQGIQAQDGESDGDPSTV